MSRRKRELTICWQSPQEYFESIIFETSKNILNYNKLSHTELISTLSYDTLYNYITYHTDRSFVIVDSNKKIINVSKKWTEMCGYSKEEIYNKTFAVLQGKKTDKKTIQEFENNLEKFKQSSMNIINYNKNREEMHCNVECIIMDYKTLSQPLYETPKFLCEIKLI